jgi:hypothetical protein
MPEESLLESAPVESAELETAVEETGADTGMSDDVPTDETGGEESLEADGEPLSASKLWRDLKEPLKAVDPKLRSALNKAIHKAEAYEKKFPEGLNHVETAMSAIQQLSDDPALPMEKVIEEAIANRDYFRDLDSKFTSGSPEFVAALADAEPNAFQAMMPNALAKFAEVNPEGHSAYIAKATMGYLNEAETPLQFSILRTFLPQLPAGPVTDQIIAACEKIFGTVQGLKGFADKPITPKFDPKTPEQPNDGMDVAERETKITLREWNSEFRDSGVNMVMSEAAKVNVGRTKLTETEQKQVLGKVSEELDARLAVNKDYGKAMQGYLRAGNKTAFNQRLQSERKKLIPGATRRAVDDVVAARPKGVAKPAAAAPAKPGAVAGAKPLQGATQYSRISGHPSTQGLKIDLNRTSNSMLVKQQAYVVGQNNPVTWQRAAK